MKQTNGGEGSARRWVRVHEYTDGSGGGMAAADSGSLSSYGAAPRPTAVTGEGRPPILLLHGFTGSAESWGESLLAELSKKRPVLAVDLPGHGEGALIPDSASCGVEEVAGALCEILEERGIERADWIGYSMGGRIALAAAALRPERVRRLVLEGASPGLDDGVERARRRESDQDLARAIEDRGIEWFVDYWMGLPLFETQTVLPPTLLQESRTRRRKGGAEALAAALRGLGTGAQPSYWDALPRITAPTLLLTGEFDRKYEEVAGRMAAALPRCEHRSLAGAGHNLHFEAPERWIEAILGFLDR